MGGSSGSSQPQQVTQTTSNLPEYARPYFEDLLNRTNNVSSQQYTPYPGQRLADGNAFTSASQGMTADIARNGAPDINRARDQLGVAGTAGASGAGFTGTYNTDTYTPGQITTGTFGQNAAGYYMSPYQQAVTDVQKNNAVLDFQRGQSTRDDSAIRAGAFGGSRQAIQAGLAQQGLSRQLGEIQATGSQNAFTNAQSQFNADQGRALTAQQNTEQSRQFGATFGDSSQRYNADDAARAAGIRLNAGNMSLQAAQGYGQLGSTDQSLALQRAQALGTTGQQISATQQAGLDMSYQDFVNQRDYDRQNLNFYSGILRGTPVSAQSEVATYQNPNPLNQVVGAGIAGLGAYKALS